MKSSNQIHIIYGNIIQVFLYKSDTRFYYMNKCLISILIHRIIYE